MFAISEHSKASVPLEPTGKGRGPGLSFSPREGNGLHEATPGTTS